MRAGSDRPWESVRDELAAHRTLDTIEALEFVLPSPFVTTESRRWPSTHAARSRRAGTLLDAAVSDLSRRIHADFRYDPKATRIDTPLLEVLRSRRGVCQDFAHLMIGMLRSLGLAARYVSGYLRSRADTYTGAEASHAWVSALVPGVGWLDIDPTNDVRPGPGISRWPGAVTTATSARQGRDARRRVACRQSGSAHGAGGRRGLKAKG